MGAGRTTALAAALVAATGASPATGWKEVCTGTDPLTGKTTGCTQEIEVGEFLVSCNDQERCQTSSRCVFRSKPITDSGATRSPIPVPSRSLFGANRNRAIRPM